MFFSVLYTHKYHRYLTYASIKQKSIIVIYYFSIIFIRIMKELTKLFLIHSDLYVCLKTFI